MNLTLMNLFTNIIDTLMVAYFLTKLLDKTCIDKKKSRLFLTGLIIFNTLVNLVFGLANILGLIAILTVSTIVYSYLLDTEFVKTLIYSMLATIFMFIIEIMVINTITMIFRIDPSMILYMNIYRIISIITAKGLFYLLIRYAIEKLRIQKDTKFNGMTPIILIGFFNIVIIFMTFTLYKYMEIKSTIGYIYLSAMGMGAIVFSWLIYRITQKMIYQSQQEIIWKMREEEFHKKDFYIKSMNDILQTIKSQRHDLNNYLSTLYGLIYLGRFEDAEKYITEINDRISNMNNIIETSHPVITALVSMKKNKAFEDNIDMILDIDLPEDLPLDFVDLSIIIGNLLDNAIEACQLIKEEMERKIELTIYVKKDYLIIQINNTKASSIKVETENIIGRFTTKSEQVNHGFGLGNIEYVVKQYNGIMNIEDLGNEFRVNIALLMGEDVSYDINFTNYAI